MNVCMQQHAPEFLHFIRLQVITMRHITWSAIMQICIWLEYAAWINIYHPLKLLLEKNVIPSVLSYHFTYTMIQKEFTAEGKVCGEKVWCLKRTFF